VFVGTRYSTSISVTAGFIISRIYCTDECMSGWEMTDVIAVGVRNRELFRGNIPGQRLALSTIMKLHDALAIWQIMPGEVIRVGCAPCSRAITTARLYISYEYTVTLPEKEPPCDNTSTS
jgi:hypothetical protein